MAKTPIFLLVLLLCLPFTLQAQDEYRLELGAGAGLGFYLGDANSTPYKNSGASFTLLARRILNPRMAVKFNLGMGHISGNTEKIFFPADAWQESAEGGKPGTATFKRNVFEFGTHFELNFLGYGIHNAYLGNKRWTPYVSAGLGVCFAPKPVDAVFAFQVPLGIGIKYKLRERLNIGLEWNIHFTTTDKLDVSNETGVQLNDPYGIKSSGFKNKDCYSFTTLFITYDLWAKCRTCNKI